MKMLGFSDDPASGARVGALLMLAALTTAVSSCDSPTAGLASSRAGASLSVDPAVLILNDGESGAFQAVLRDAAGQPTAARDLTWTSLHPGVASVFQDGRVEARHPGEATVRVHSDAHDAMREVTVLVRPVADDVALVVRDEVHHGVAGDPLPDSVEVRVVDKGGLPVAGVPLQFDVEAGEGVVSPVVVTTDQQGYARVEWTLGIAVGANAVEVAGAPAAGASGVAAPPKLRTRRKKLHAWGGAGRPSKVMVQPEVQILTVDGTERLSATVVDRWGNVVDDALIEWSSSNAAVATVDQAGTVIGRQPGDAVVQARARSASGSPAWSGGASPPQAEGTASITVESAAANAALTRAGGNAQTGRVGERLAEPLVVRLVESGVGIPGVLVSWSVSGGGGQLDTGATTTDATGAAQVTWTLGTSPGQQEVTAWAAGTNAVTFRASAAVGVAARVDVQPAAVSLEAGASRQLTGSAFDRYNNPIANRPLAWSSADGTVAGVDVGGFVTAVSAGSTRVTATLDGATGSSTVTVTGGSSGGNGGTFGVAVAPSAHTLNSIGARADLAATVTDQDGNVVSGAEVTWSSLSPQVVSVDAFGRVTSHATGVVMITASLASGVADTATIHSRQVVAAVTLVPATLSLVAGNSATLTATVQDSLGVPVANASYTWSTSDAGVATVVAQGAESTRRVEARSPGTATVSVQADGVGASASVTVTAVPVASVTVVPASMSLTVGESGTATAELRDAAGNVIQDRETSWSSSDPTIAIVNGGLVTALSKGSAEVRAEADGQLGTLSITVEEPEAPPPPPPVATVAVTPSSAQLEVGETVQLSAATQASDGTLLDRPVTWSTSNSTVASVSQSGRVTGGGQGTAVVTAHSEGVTGSATVTVTGSSQTDVDVVLRPGDNVQSIINQNPAGTVFGFEPGTYPRLELTPKDRQVFVGGAGVVLDGMNDTRFAFHGAAVGLHLKDLEITGYTGLNDDFAAIHGWDGVDWVLENLNVHHNYTSGASLRAGGTVLGGHYHHNGRLGIYATQTQNITIRGAEISYNNAEGRYDPLWSAGGIKITVSDNVTVENTYVHDNNGPGIWYDISCTNGKILGNTVTDNGYAGVFYEVSTTGLIQGNVVRNNGHAMGPPGYYGAGILVSESADVTVERNQVVGNKNGVLGLHGDRREHGVSNLLVRDNDIEMSIGLTGLLDTSAGGTPNLVTGRGNRFDGNRYRLHQLSKPFLARSSTRTISEWQALGQDVNSDFTQF